ncbi:MAG: hypothetical protein ABI042_02505, partial [Verrucomicrobiota bacterium]
MKTLLTTRFAMAIALFGAITESRAATVTIDARSVFQSMEGFGTSSRVFDDPHVFDNFDTNTLRSATVL